MTAAMGGMGQQPEEVAMNQQPAEEAGRGGDDTLGHLTRGEVVIPPDVLSRRGVLETIQQLFEESGLDMEEYTVGSEKNKVNPETGYPEFFSFVKIFTGKSRSQRERDAMSKAERQQQKRLDAQYKRMMAAIAEQKAELKKKSRFEKHKVKAEAIQSQLAFKKRLASIKAPELLKGQSAVAPGDPQKSKDTLPMQKRKFARRRNIAGKISAFNKRRPI